MVAFIRLTLPVFDKVQLDNSSIMVNNNDKSYQHRSFIYQENNKGTSYKKLD